MPGDIRIVLATAGSLGDLYPFIAIGRELQRRRYAPVIATLACHRDDVVSSGARFAGVRPNLAMTDPVFMKALAALPCGLESLAADCLVPKMRESLADLVACCRGAAVMVVGSLSYAAPLAAQACDVPWIAAHLAPLYASRALAGAAAPSSARVSRAVEAERARLRHESAIPPIAPAGALGLFSSVLDRPGDRADRLAVTGFARWDRSVSVAMPLALERFLDAGDPPIVFALGSTAVFDAETFFDESARAAAALGRRAVLITSAEARDGACRWSDHAIAVPYTPYSILFPRAAAIVHHGGIGTTAQALHAGRPMLVVPRFLDQPDNGARLRRLGVARVMHATVYSAATAAHELRALLDQPSYAIRARAVAAAVRREHGAAAACDAIERILAAGGVAAAGGRRLPPTTVVH